MIVANCNLKIPVTPFAGAHLMQDEIQIGAIIQMAVKCARILCAILEMCNTTNVCVVTAKSMTTAQ